MAETPTTSATAPQPKRPSGAGVGLAGWQRVLAALVLLLGITATLAVSISQHVQETRRTRQAFFHAAETIFDKTIREIQLFMEVLDSIRNLHALSDQITPAHFEEVVRKGMVYQRRILGAYGFTQQLGQNVRTAYKEKFGDSRNEWVVTDHHGGFIPAPEKSTYFPLIYQIPPLGLGVPDGYDFGSTAAQQEAISAMTQYGVFALAGAVEGSPPENPELYMFAPIMYGPPGGRGTLYGFAVALFHPDRILKTAMETGADGLQVRLEEAGAATSTAAASAWRFDRDFSLGHQEWRFTADADMAYWHQIRNRAPLWTALIGLLVTFMVSGTLFWMAGRSKRIENLVKERTAELAASNEQLHQVMEDRRRMEDEVLGIATEERARVGRDLHDSLGQKLTGILYLFRAYRQHCPAEADAESGAEQITSTLKESIAQIRRIAQGLAPVALTEVGLSDALKQLAAESASLFGIQIEFSEKGDCRLASASTAEHLYLITQEAVNNAVKHGRSTRITITLACKGKNGVLTIEDNGTGMPAGQTPEQNGSGLRIMKHRADVFGGELTVHRAPSGGTLIQCRFAVAGPE